jgi:hypothetical protein
LRDILRKYSLVGYHCTKLVREEINDINSNGMLLQNGLSLNTRIYKLQKNGIIDEQLAIRLKNKNQADDSNRAKMLWFCFYKPYIAGQSGVERFFRSWGGEALYNSHEGISDTGNALLGIGIPCVIKVNVPINSLQDSYFPDSAIIGAFLQYKGHSITNPIEHEGYSIKNIAPNNVMEIVEYPDSRFIELTKCDKWENKL